MSAAEETRNVLSYAGYSSIPINGKIPALKTWQEKIKTNSEEIAL
jgi:hypothetical protein